MAARAQGDAGGATAPLHDVVEGQEAFTGAPVRRAHREPAQILGRLTPAGMLNQQHDGTGHLLALLSCPILPQPATKTIGLELVTV